MYGTCRPVPLDHALFDLAVHVEPGINQRVGAFSSEKAEVMNKGADQFVFALAYAGKRERKGFAQVGSIHLLRIQKAQLPGFEIQLDAIMTQAVHAKNPHDAATRKKG